MALPTAALLAAAVAHLCTSTVHAAKPPKLIITALIDDLVQSLWLLYTPGHSLCACAADRGQSLLSASASAVREPAVGLACGGPVPVSYALPAVSACR